jgi:hypothetical protein
MNAFYGVMVVVGLVFALGVWESTVAHSHEPSSTDSPGYIHGYIFTVVTAVMNIMSSVFMLCYMMIRKEEDKDSSASLLPCVVGIWSIVLFSGMITGDIHTGPFIDVVIVQFVITIFGFFLLCCSCLMISCMISHEPTDKPATVEDVSIQV